MTEAVKTWTWKDMVCPFCGDQREREVWTYLPTGAKYGAWTCSTCDRDWAERRGA